MHLDRSPHLVSRTALLATLAALAAGLSGCIGNDIPLGGVDAAGDAPIDASTDAPIDGAGVATWHQQTQFDTWRPRDVGGTSSDDAWMVGTAGSVWRWNGTTWNFNPTPDASVELTAVWMASATRGFAAGQQQANGLGRIFAWNGTSWSEDPTVFDSAMTGVWGAADRAWSVGHAFNFHLYQPPPDDTWTRITGPDIVYWPEDVWVSAADGEVWLAGNQGLTRFRATDNTRIDAYPGSFLGVWGRDASDVWAVGVGGAIQHWNGSTWTPTPSNVTTDLRAVWASSASDAWAVGDQGTIVHWNGSTWTPLTPLTDADLYGVWGSSATDVWAVGGSIDVGIVLRYSPV